MTNTVKIRLAIIDDQHLFRESLAALLADIPDFELIIEAENGRDFLTKLTHANQLPHIALMDMEMPEMDGTTLREQLQKLYPAIAIIVLSVHAKERLVAHMIESGCNGYLVKNCNKTELMTAIHSVFTNGFYINATTLRAIQIAAANKSRISRNPQIASTELTNRETEVLRLICKEYSNLEIAQLLFISVRTVEGHRNNLLLKTGCRNTAGLVLFAIRHQITDVLY